jgi:hypothetical protein
LISNGPVTNEYLEDCYNGTMEKRDGSLDNPVVGSVIIVDNSGEGEQRRTNLSCRRSGRGRGSRRRGRRRAPLPRSRSIPRRSTCRSGSPRLQQQQQQIGSNGMQGKGRDHAQSQLRVAHERLHGGVDAPEARMTTEASRMTTEASRMTKAKGRRGDTMLGLDWNERVRFHLDPTKSRKRKEEVRVGHIWQCQYGRRPHH